MEQPSIIVRYLHAIPRFNITLNRVGNEFNPSSIVYIESLGILASIPAALLILSLVGLLLYLLTRCCDRKSKRDQSNGCQKCILIFFSILCAIAIGAGLYGNDELHTGISEVFGSGRRVESLVKNVRNQTESLKYNLKTKVTVSELEDTFDKPTHDQAKARKLQDSVQWVKDNTTLAINALESVSYLIKSSHSEQTIRNLFDRLEFFETVRMPATLGFLVLILVLCVMLVIGLARSSRCTLILFSVFGLLTVTISWLLSSVYFVSAIALGDFCIKPHEYICNQQRIPDIHYTNCGTLGTNAFILRLNESRDHIDRAKVALQFVSMLSPHLYPRDNLTPKIIRFESELKNCKYQLADLSAHLDRRTVEQHYISAAKALCGSSLFGLTLLLLASLVSAFTLTILVYVDSHVWIYLSKKRSYGDNKSEMTPLFPSGGSMSPPAPVIGSGVGGGGTSTINRTLLHHQQQNQFSNGSGIGGNGSAAATGTLGRNGTAGIRGRHHSSGHHTLGRLPSQHHNNNINSNPYGTSGGPSSGKYATLSKQCKTLEANDYY